MAEPLTGNEAGFFSRIQESPSLFLAPTSLQVVALVGEGKDTKTTAEDLTRSATENSDALANPVSSITAASSNAIFRYPQSSYAIAKVGTADGTIADVDTLTFKVTVDGETQETHTFAGATTTITAAVAALDAAFSDVSFEVSVAGNMVIYVSGSGLAGKSFTVDDGTANTACGYADDTRADSLRWDPAVTDANFAPQASEAYTVEYERPKVAADYKPQAFTGLGQVVREYGDASATNTLSLGAQAAFGNGSTLLYCRQLDPTEVALGATEKKAEIVAALVDYEVEDIDIIVSMVPLTDDTSLAASYLDHVSKMSSKLERRERMAILGADEISAALPLTGGSSWTSLMANFDVAASSGLESKRIMVVSPGRVLTNYKGTSIETDGTYLAAGLAGRMVNSAFDEATPMTRKTLTTIDELVLPGRSRSEKNILTGLGATIMEISGGTVLVRRAVTANATSIASQEPSIVRAFDRVAREVREALENRFIGAKILGPTTKDDVEAATQTFLNRLVADEIIGAHREIKAEQNTVEPRQFDVTFEAIPVYPFIWGMVDLSISIS